MAVKKFLSTLSYSIIACGSAITFDNGADLQVKLDFDEAKFSFTVIFNFIDDESKRQSMALTSNSAEHVIEVKCKNFNNPLGIGTTKPLELASVAGRRVLLHFWVHILGESSSRKVDYSFYYEQRGE